MTIMKAPEIQMILDFGGEEALGFMGQESHQVEVETNAEPASTRKLMLVYSAPVVATTTDAKSKETRVLQNLVAHARALGW